MMVTADDAQYAVNEWHFLRGLCGLRPERVCLRLGMSPLALVYRFERLGIEPPTELVALRRSRTVADLEHRLDERQAVAG